MASIIDQTESGGAAGLAAGCETQVQGGHLDGQLGLKLEAKRGPAETLFIDHAERAPKH
jgi:uncharacterized protein (TIGR03435 family)